MLARDMGEQPEGGRTPGRLCPRPPGARSMRTGRPTRRRSSRRCWPRGMPASGRLTTPGHRPPALEFRPADVRRAAAGLGEGPAGLDDDSGRDTAVVPAVRLSGAPQGSDDVAFRFEEPEEPRAVPLVRPMARGAEATAISDVRGSEAGAVPGGRRRAPRGPRPTVPHVTIPDEDDLASPVVPVDPEEVAEPRARRTGRGPRRPGRRRSLRSLRSAC